MCAKWQLRSALRLGVMLTFVLRQCCRPREDISVVTSVSRCGRGRSELSRVPEVPGLRQLARDLERFLADLLPSLMASAA
jgi:hypothetical protein